MPKKINKPKSKMTTTPSDDPDGSKDPSTAEFDAMCSRFELGWREGRTLSIEECLQGCSPGARAQLLTELLLVELELRRKAGEQPIAEEYLRRFPEESSVIEEVFDRTIGIGSPNFVRAKESGLSVRCPHCHSPIELVVDAPIESIDCPICGSNFSLVGHSESTRHAPPITEFGHFRLTERLGIGGYGTVWKALDTELDRTVAVKIPRRRELQPDEEEQFLREARSAAQLSHPNIVSVHEVGRQGETIYIVSDFIRGVDLAELSADSPLGQRESVEIVAKLTDALQHAHERGVIHRDLKPQNVMIDGDGEPHLMDFGLAKRETGEISVTLDGVILGTPAYMSPEQARGDSKEVDSRTDVYSLGVMLYQLLTHELPFRGTPRMLVHKVINDEAPSPRRLNQAVTRDLETITLKCLQKSPTSRYQSAVELGDELRRWLSGEPIRARPVSAFEKTIKAARRKPIAAALVVLAATLAVGGPLVAVRQSRLLIQRNEAIKEAQAANGIAAEALSEAKEERASAEKSRTQAQRDLARSYVEKGIEHAGWKTEVGNIGGRVLLRDVDRLTSGSVWGAGDPMQAVLWFREAMRVDPDSANEKMHRIRIASALTQCPQTVGLCIHENEIDLRTWEGRLQHAEVGDRILSRPSESEVLLWDHKSGVLSLPPIRHGGPVLHASVSRDGKLIATAGDDNVAKVWDGDTGRAILRLRHPSTVTFACFHPTKNQLVTGCKDGKVRFWGLDDGALSKGTIDLGHSIEHLAFRRNGERLLTWDSDSTARVWDSDTLEAISPAFPHGKNSVQSTPGLSADGRVLMTVFKQRCYFWDCDEEEELLNTVDQGPIAIGAVLSPSGRHAIVKESADKFRLYDVLNSSYEIFETERRCRFYVFNHDGSKFALGNSRGWIQVVNTNSGNPFYLGYLTSAGLRFLEFTPRGDDLLIADHQDTVRLVRLPLSPPQAQRISYTGAIGRESLPAIRSFGGKYDAIVTSPCGKIRCRYGGSSGCVLEETATDHELHRFGNAEFSFATFTAEGRALVASDQKHVHFLDVRTMRPFAAPIEIDQRINDAIVSDNLYWAAVTTPKDVLFYDLEAGKRKRKFTTGRGRGETRIALSKSGRYFAANYRGSRFISVYDTQRLKQHTLSDSTQSGDAIDHSFSQDESSVLASFEEGFARLFDVKQLSALGPPLRHDRAVMGGSLGPNPQIAVVAEGDGGLYLWDTYSGRLLSYPCKVPGEIQQCWFFNEGEVGCMVKGDAKGLDYPYYVYRYQLPDLKMSEAQLDALIDLVIGFRIDQKEGLVQISLEDLGRTLQAGREAWLKSNEDSARVAIDSEEAVAVYPYVTPIAPEEAWGRYGQLETVEFEIAQARITNRGNNLQLWSTKTFSVFLREPQHLALLEREGLQSSEQLTGRIAIVRGVVNNYRGTTQIIVEDLSNLAIILPDISSGDSPPVQTETIPPGQGNLIAWEDASQHVGEKVTVRGPVNWTWHDDGQVIFSFSQERGAMKIVAAENGASDQTIEKYVRSRNKTIEATGALSVRYGVPTLDVEDLESIRIVDGVVSINDEIVDSNDSSGQKSEEVLSWQEAGERVGAPVVVGARVFSVSDDTDGKIFFRFSRRRGSMVLAVEHDTSHLDFAQIKERYFEREIVFRGVVDLWGGAPVIYLKDLDQIEILETKERAP